MTANKKDKNWTGYKNIVLPLGHKADVNNLTILASLLCDSREGKVDLLHVIEEGKYSHLPHEWREGSKRVTESHHLLMGKGIKSERSITTSNSIEKGILEQARENEADAILLGWGPKPKSSISALVSHIMSRADCDVIVFKTRNKPDNIKDIIYPVAKEPGINRLQLISHLMKGAEASLTFAHVLGNSSKEKGSELLERSVKKAAEIGIEAKDMLISGKDIAESMSSVSDDFDLVILGPSGGWWLKKTLFGHKTDDIATKVNCSVLLHKDSQD